MKRLIAVLFLFSSVTIPAFPKEADDLSFCSVSKNGPLPLTSEIFKTIGYKVLFPDAISEDLSVKDISIGIGLSVMISQEQFEKIHITMTDAIEDDNSLIALSAYKPFRQTGAFYINADRSKIVVVATMPEEKYRILEKTESADEPISRPFKVHGVDCTWIYGSESPALYFCINRISYMIFSIEGAPLTREDAVKFAAPVIESNLR